jgi:hypothetical protein
MTWRSACVVALGLSGWAAPAPAQQYLVVIGGIGGEPRYEAAFSSHATRLVEAARTRYGLPSDRIVLLTENPDRDGAGGRSTKNAIDRAFTQLAARVSPGAEVFVVLIGHGSGVGGSPRFNLPGPDATAADFATWLERLTPARIVIANLASASGGFLAPLAASGRVVITATRSVTERNEVLFAEHFVRALAEDGADLDKDERVSMLEAFTFARAEVVRIYERDNRLLTEHAMLDDDGDGQATDTPTADGPDGRLAATIALGRTEPHASAVDDPVLADLYETRARLRRELDDLRALRGGMDPDAYDAGLERILLELARTGRAIREREGGGP